MKTPFPEYDALRVDAIEEHLDQQYLTEIVAVQSDQDLPGMQVIFARGAMICDRPGGTHFRPMLQIIPRDAYSGCPGFVEPCPACDRWDRSWNCPEHPEIEWDTVRGGWKDGPMAVRGPAPEPRPAVEYTLQQYTIVFDQQSFRTRTRTVEVNGETLQQGSLTLRFEIEPRPEDDIDFVARFWGVSGGDNPGAVR